MRNINNKVVSDWVWWCCCWCAVSVWYFVWMYYVQHTDVHHISYRVRLIQCCFASACFCCATYCFWVSNFVWASLEKWVDESTCHAGTSACTKAPAAPLTNVAHSDIENQQCSPYVMRTFRRCLLVSLNVVLGCMGVMDMWLYCS